MEIASIVASRVIVKSIAPHQFSNNPKVSGGTGLFCVCFA
jgi:hypothetical protein